MKTYTLKLSSGTAYKLYDGTTLVTDAKLATLFGAAGSAYFVFDFNSGTPSGLTSVSITNSSDTEVMGITGLAAGTVKENYNFKGAWDGTTTTFTSFAQLTGQTMDEAQLGFLMGEVKESLGSIGKARELTTADYNWPTTGTKNKIALWLLDSGVYYVPRNSMCMASTSDYVSTGVCIVSRSETGIVERAAILWLRNTSASWGLERPGMVYCSTKVSTGEREKIFSLDGPIDNLTSTSTNATLSANQGKVLKDLIDGLAISGAGAPTTATVGTVGKLYEDTTNGKLYICTDATNPYVWEEVGGSSGPTVVQTVGTSTTDVMSQDATSKMVFPYPTITGNIAIGSGAVVRNGQSMAVAIGNSAKGNETRAVAIGDSANVSKVSGVAIGHEAHVTGVFSIALGEASNATQQGQMDISASYGIYSGTGRGYNFSDYRLLTGLYDPQSAHDAATKGYVDTAVAPLTGTTAPDTTTVGTVGKMYIDTTNQNAYICVGADTVTPSYTWKQITS